MVALLGIFFALLAMLAFGLGDIFIKKTAQAIGPFFTFLYRSIFTILLLFLGFTIFIKDYKKLLPPTSILLVVLIMGLSGAVAFLAYCKALQIGKVSIISPISHTAVIISVLLAIIFFKERLTVLQGIAITLIIAGVICVSFKWSELLKLKPKQIVKGLPYALVTVVCWGLLYFIIKIPTVVVGPFITALYLETLQVAYLLPIVFFKKVRKPAPKIWLYIAFIGLSAALGTPLSTLAVKHAGVAIVTPIIFAVPLVTVVLAFLILKERLELNQLVSVLAICAGIILAAI